MIDKDYCLPVERDQRGFIISPEWVEYDLPFPRIIDLQRKLKNPYEIVEDDVYYNGEFSPATIYIFKDKEETPIAVLKSPETVNYEILEKNNVFNSYFSALKNSVDFTEYVFPEQKTRLDAIFIQPCLSRFDDPQGKTFFLSKIESEPRILILGPAGGGKTTILRNLIKTGADAGLLNTSDKIPVYIQCRNFYNYSNLQEAIIRQIKSLQGEKIIEQFNNLSDKGKLWFAFDGIDEVPSEKRSMFSKAILDFIYKNKRCKYLVSSRWLADNYLDNSFLRISINPFNENQITEFTYHKLHSHKMWRPFIERIKEESEIFDLAGNPLALGLIITRYLRKEHTPLLMTEVLSDIINLFIDEWDSRRGIVRSLTKTLSAKIVFRALSRIAEHLKNKKLYDFNINEVQSTLRFVLETERTKDNDLLEEIGITTSLIQKCGNGRWKFTHRTVQEYLSAVNRVDELSGYIKNVFLMFDENESDIKDRYLRYLLGTASDATEVVSHTIDTLTSNPQKKHHLYLLNHALAERVSVEPTVADKYSQLVSKYVDEAINNLTKLEVKKCHLEKTCVRLNGSAPNSSQVEHFKKLLLSIRSLRDGSLSKRIIQAIENSENINAKNIADLIKSEGILRFQISKGIDKTDFQIEIIRVRTDLK